MAQASLPGSEKLSEGDKGMSTKDVLSAGSVIITVVGGLLYAMIYLGYVQFYGDFGIAPSDAGQGPAQIISAAGVGLSLFAATAISVGAAAWGLAALCPARTERRKSQIKALSLSLAIVATLGLSTILNNYWYRDGYFGFVLVGSGALVAGIWLGGWPIQRRRISVPPVAVWAAAAAIVYLCAVLFLERRGYEMARNIKYYATVQDSVLIFAIHPALVCAAPTGGTPTRYIYLGKDSDTYVLFNTSVNVVQRIPDTVTLFYIQTKEINPGANSTICVNTLGALTG
jgi:hypothetical protein